MQLKRAAMFAALGIPLLAGGVQAQMVTQTMQITSEGAKAMIDACEAYAEEHGMNLALWVVDQTDTPIRFKRMEGASTIAVDTAFRKAISARMYGLPTNPDDPAVERFLSTEQGQQFFLQIEFWPAPGGHPIRVDGKVIGAFATGGGGGGRELPCVQAALAAFEAGLSSQRESGR